MMRKEDYTSALVALRTIKKICENAECCKHCPLGIDGGFDCIAQSTTPSDYPLEKSVVEISSYRIIKDD